MKQIKKIIIAILIGLTAMVQATVSSEAQKYAYIRLHVIADSNQSADQAVKLKVRDAILKEYGPILAAASSKYESREIICRHLDDIECTAEEVLAQYQMQNPVHAEYSREVFPDKTYGSICYPAGQYTALRVIIGSGRGANWWCVMFPPLCIGAEEMAVNDKADVQYRFKLVELFQNHKIKAEASK